MFVCFCVVACTCLAHAVHDEAPSNLAPSNLALPGHHNSQHPPCTGRLAHAEAELAAAVRRAEAAELALTTVQVCVCVCVFACVCVRERVRVHVGGCMGRQVRLYEGAQIALFSTPTHLCLSFHPHALCALSVRTA